MARSSVARGRHDQQGILMATTVKRSVWKSFTQWFDTGVQPDSDDDGVDWLRIIPFIGMHLACLGVFFVGWSPIAVITAVALYLLRMFAITGFYHRYFSHRAFKTSRPVQFLFAAIASGSVQRGPLWWAAHHRGHHRYSDTPLDPHSPRGGFLRSHMGWFLNRRNFATRIERVRDWARFPELRFLDRFDLLIPVLLASALFLFGKWAQVAHPEWGTSAGQMLVWGFFVSTVVLYHGTFTINSLAHRFGRQRFATGDDSRNNPWLAIITLGEGWHNNHHRYPAAARQGFYWWEYDMTWYLLKAMAAVGLVWDLKGVPRRVIDSGRSSAP